MEKKFEEKFGLKVEEMEEILGGLTSPDQQGAEQPQCGVACSTCVYCTSCIGCTGGCTACKTIAFIGGMETPIDSNIGNQFLEKQGDFEIK